MSLASVCVYGSHWTWATVIVVFVFLFCRYTIALVSNGHSWTFCNSYSRVLNYFFLRATKGRRQFKDRCLRAKWSSLPYAFLCILELTKGQTSMVCRPDLRRHKLFKQYLIVLHTLCVHYTHATANLNSGYSKYAKAARMHYFCTIALRTSRAVLTRAWALRRIDLRERRVDSFSKRVIIFCW